MLPFWISIAALSLVQAVVVALPRAVDLGRLSRMRRAWWGVIPPLSVVAFVFGAGAAQHASGQALTYLALVAVPLLAALALGWSARGARPFAALLVVPLFALAWADRGALPGQAASTLLTALSGAALGSLIAGVTPPRWLGLGIVAMALADTALVISDLLARPNNALNAAHPAAGLPRLQSAAFGSAVIGYGDLFVAGALGGLLAFALGRRWQLQAALLTAALALCFDLLFFAVRELPATVPVAVALLLTLAATRRRAVPPRSARRAAPAPRRPRAPARS
jgi:hypothetical protein